MSNWSNIFGGPIILPEGTSAGHNHDARDITSSIIPSARLGSGNPSSANYLRGDGAWTTPVTSVNGGTGAVSITAAGIGAAASSHNHDASNISSGTIATARLGSGTANSTTYLRGDQTWATVSGGDTTYNQTVSDCENTNIRTTLVQFNVPGNTWLDGEYIDVFIHYRVFNTTGVDQSLLVGYYRGGGLVDSEVNAVIQNNTIRTHIGFFRFLRDGEIMKYLRPGTNTVFSQIIGPSFSSHDSTYNWPGWITDGINFAGTQTMQIRAKWEVANPSLGLRIVNTRVVKYAGQKT
jgi:hypothetical protein